MIGYLEGIIIAHTQQGIILLVNSVGYDILGTKLQDQLGKQLAIYTHLAVGSDNQPTLIGFSTLEARTLFRQLLKVPGIGPKTALSITESAPLDNLRTAIVAGDLTFFTSVKGVGKKAAQKIILELKNQLVDDPQASSSHRHIYEALSALRFTNQEISQAIKAHDLTGLSENESIKIILQSLGK